MKARVKATGEIIEVREEYDLREAMPQVFYSNEEDPYEVYEKEELDFNVNDNMNPTIDYWTRLEHQYAGMAMQGILSNSELFKATAKNAEEFGLEVRQALAIDAKVYATALVEKLKNEQL